MTGLAAAKGPSGSMKNSRGNKANSEGGRQGLNTTWPYFKALVLKTRSEVKFMVMEPRDQMMKIRN